MNSRLPPLQRILFLAVLAALLALIWAGVVRPIGTKFSKIDAEILAAQAARIRLKNIIAKLETAPQASSLPEGVLWVGASANLVHADFQQKLGVLAAQNRVTFNSVTPLSIGRISDIPTVALRVEGQSAYSDFLAFMNAAMRTTPKIAISAFSIRQLPAQANVLEVPISFQVSFWAAISLDAEG